VEMWRQKQRRSPAAAGRANTCDTSPTTCRPAPQACERVLCRRRIPSAEADASWRPRVLEAMAARPRVVEAAAHAAAEAYKQAADGRAPLGLPVQSTPRKVGLSEPAPPRTVVNRAPQAWGSRGF
jgi:hypothetical protein